MILLVKMHFRQNIFAMVVESGVRVSAGALFHEIEQQVLAYEIECCSRKSLSVNEI